MKCIKNIWKRINAIKNKKINLKSTVTRIFRPILIIIKIDWRAKMFKLHSEFKPTGDQPQAIEYLSKGIQEGKKFQTLLGVTGSGKTFTMANIIQKVQKPTLILAHNKTLAGQLYSEFKEFFPENSVEYFVSYYDYYHQKILLLKVIDCRILYL